MIFSVRARRRSDSCFKDRASITLTAVYLILRSPKSLPPIWPKVLNELLANVICIHSKMAASSENLSEWRSLLNSLTFFDKIRKQHEYSEGSEPKNLFAIEDGRIFLWDGESRLLTANLHDIIATDTTLDANESLSNVTPFKVLLLY